MRFVLEEASWAWDGSDPGGYVERIEQLLDRLDVARDREEEYAASRELLAQSILPGLMLCDLLFNPDSPLAIPREVIERVSATFGSIRYWDDALEWPAIDVEIDGEAVVSPSAALAHARVGKSLATACLPLPGRWAGRKEVSVQDRKERVHFVVDAGTHRAFFRDALDVERVDEAGLAALAPHAFPDLWCLDDLWDGVRHFEGGYARVRDGLHQFLAVLDDHGAWIFTDETGRLTEAERSSPEQRPVPASNQVIERRFRARGLEIAPENPDVKADGRCRRAREKVLRGRTLYCEWHCKFEPHINRAHLHPPVPESGGKVIIAIFRDHLPLPGDR
jgi:hypothetical protein